MDLENAKRWSHNYRVERLPGLPAGEPVLQFIATPTRLVREGLVARLSGDSQSWLGNFQCGDGAIDSITATPSPHHVCVVAAGRGYWVPVSSPGSFEVVPIYPVTQIAAIDDPALLVISDYTRVGAYGADGLRWVSRGISWDGIKILQADQQMISGLAWDAPQEVEVRFVIDPMTGQVQEGPEPPGSASLRVL
jgi:hypothetical protein